MDRFILDENLKRFLIHYKKLFQPIMQGFELKMLVNYFSENKDEQGDKEAMLTKVENAFLYCETGSFWARQTLKVVNEFLNKLN